MSAAVAAALEMYLGQKNMKLPEELEKFSEQLYQKYVPSNVREDGTVFVADKQIGKDCDFPDSVGIIIETPGFIPYYSGYRNLKLLADLNKKIDKEKIRNTMQMVGLVPDLKRHVKKYSFGMRQRLGLAQAIMENPDLLILDEPMNGLDKDGVSDMRKYLLNLKEQGKTILIASHSAEDIEILCDTVCEMDKGGLTKLKGW